MGHRGAIRRRRERRSPRGTLRLLWLACALMAALGCGGGHESASLLSGRAPIDTHGFADPVRLTDGAVPEEGSGWTSPWTTVARGNASVTFDLGATEPIDALWVQADHNDAYEILGSVDGSQYSPLWIAPAVATPGMRARHVRGLGVSARFLRLQPRGGDGAYSVSEILVFGRAPEPWPPEVDRVVEPSSGSQVRERLGGATVITLLWLLVLPAAARRRTLLLTTTIPALAWIVAASSVAESWPLDVTSVSFVRAAAAVLCAGGLWRLVAPVASPLRSACSAVVVLTSLVAALSFFNFGRAQFFDHARGVPSFVHYFDMRVYFPQGKYFDELGFDGVYAASVAAMLADDPQASPASLRAVPMRDLRTHAVVGVGQAMDHIEEVRSRFTPERWDRLVEDMRYFRLAIGARDYLRSLLDHGGNATPVWLANAKLLFSPLSASHATLVGTALIDPLLLLAALVAVARVFGVVPALVCALVFGANDYHMGGGTNWAGATLRHDWLAALLGAGAALGARRFFVGGALLGASTMLRAFPALAFVGVVATLCFAVMDRRRGKEAPSLQPSLAVLAGGAAAMVALGAYSVVVLEPAAWSEWIAKMRLLSGEAHPNHVSLKLLFSFDPDATFEALDRLGRGGAWQQLQEATFQRRRPVFVAAVGMVSAAVLLACRHARPHQAALLGLLLVPVWLYPANYYLHFVCALPLLADVPRDLGQLPGPAALVWLALLGLCGLSYLTVSTPHVDAHYFQLTVLTFCAWPLVLLGFWRQRRLAPPPSRA